jgi:hypothetical protein
MKVYVPDLSFLLCPTTKRHVCVVLGTFARCHHPRTRAARIPFRRLCVRPLQRFIISNRTDQHKQGFARSSW